MGNLKEKNMKQVFRREHKYLLTCLESQNYRNKMSKLLSADPHNGECGYLIRSLYFDTIDDKDFIEKEAGIETRRKLRLRRYGNEESFAFLEMKQKQGENQKKRSLKLAREDAELLARGIYSPLLKYSEPFACECYGLMNTAVYRPKAIVEYRRFAFIGKESNLRITFDSDIRATESSFDLFSNTLNMSPIFEPSYVVLEVKYDEFLPSYIKDIISDVNKSRLSVSKYCVSRSVSMRYNF